MAALGRLALADGQSAIVVMQDEISLGLAPIVVCEEKSMRGCRRCAPRAPLMLSRVVVEQDAAGVRREGARRCVPGVYCLQEVDACGAFRRGERF